MYFDFTFKVLAHSMYLNVNALISRKDEQANDYHEKYFHYVKYNKTTLFMN